jgi:hypothetical protein
MVPFIWDKKKFPEPPDVMYDAEWPMRQNSLLFAGIAFGKPEYIELWKTLPADSTTEEVGRNFFIRQPVLWIGAFSSHSIRSASGKNDNRRQALSVPRKNIIFRPESKTFRGLRGIFPSDSETFPDHSETLSLKTMAILNDLGTLPFKTGVVLRDKEIFPFKTRAVLNNSRTFPGHSESFPGDSETLRGEKMSGSNSLSILQRTER